ncbi:MAG: hypothetical protein ACJ8M1_10640 [Chthoniobacterales bacterium]
MVPALNITARSFAPAEFGQPVWHSGTGDVRIAGYGKIQAWEAPAAEGNQSLHET